MKAIIGLGNLDKKYLNSRHNTGFRFVSLVSDFLTFQRKIKRQFSTIYECKFKNRQILLVKPTTFMNLSGLSVREVVKLYGLKLKDILIVHDDLDITLGNYKLQKGKGPLGHRGILDIENKLKTKNFLRLRIGIENRKEKLISGEDYVLDDFLEEESIIIKNVFESAWKEVLEKFIFFGK